MSATIDYGLARRSEAPRIAALSRDLIEQGLGWRWTPARVLAHIRRADSVVLTARAGRRTVGFAIMHFGERYAHLDLLAVDAAYQRQGIGARLVRWLEDSATVAGILAVNLELRAGNEAALAFYRALGFEEVVRIPRYYGGREPALRMMHILRLPTTAIDMPWQPPRIVS